MADILPAAATGSCFPVVFVFHKTTTSDLAELQLLGPRSRLSPTTASPALGRPLDLQVGVLGFIGLYLSPIHHPLSSSDRRSSGCARDHDSHTGCSMHKGAFSPQSALVVNVVLTAISTHSLVSYR